MSCPKLFLKIFIFSLFMLFNFSYYSCGSQDPEVKRVGKKHTAIGENDINDQDDEDALPDPDSGEEPTPSPTITPTPTDTPTPTSSINTIDDAVTIILEDEIKTSLSLLASPELEGRGTGETGGDKAAEYVAEKFKEYGLTPGFNGIYLQPFSASGRATNNVVGYLEGNDPVLKDQYIVIGAHYDHLGKEGDTIYYGADDNASGTTAVIYAAKAIGKLKHKLRRSAIFIAFSGEELGLLGSSYYVKKPVFPIAKTKYMINLDMIGYLNYNNEKELNFLGGQSSKLAASYMEHIITKYSSVKSNITSSAGGGSDHVPFISANVPSVFMHTGTHPYYHRPSDTPEKINFNGVTNITKMATELLWAIDQGDQVPSMDSYMTLSRDEELDHGLEPFVRSPEK